MTDPSPLGAYHLADAAAERAAALREIVGRANRLYHELDAPEIPDSMRQTYTTYSV